VLELALYATGAAAQPRLASFFPTSSSRWSEPAAAGPAPRRAAAHDTAVTKPAQTHKQIQFRFKTGRFVANPGRAAGVNARFFVSGNGGRMPRRGPGLLPLARRIPRRPPIWEDRRSALRAADALLRGPLRLALKAERCFAACWRRRNKKAGLAEGPAGSPGTPRLRLG
jgi:hypothetical protein